MFNFGASVCLFMSNFELQLICDMKNIAFIEWPAIKGIGYLVCFFWGASGISALYFQQIFISIK